LRNPWFNLRERPDKRLKGLRGIAAAGKSLNLAFKCIAARGIFKRRANGKITCQWFALGHQRAVSRRIARFFPSSRRTLGWPTLLFITNRRMENRI
jgi:superfamily I DNA and RNA helicase